VSTEDVAERDRARAVFERHGAADVATGTGAGLGATRGTTGSNLNTGPRF
jgi:hypothetical protein